METQTFGNSSSKIKVFVGTNVLTSVDSAVYDDHIAHFYHLGQQSKFFVYRWAPRRYSIDRMRNMSAQQALALECDYLWFIDDDMLLSEGTLESLVAADKDIVMADTIIRGYPYHSMSFKQVRHTESGDIGLEHFDDITEAEHVNGVVDCAAVGFACCLIKTEVLKKLKAPYFCTTPNSTEDVYFCMRCKQEIPENVSIAVDLKVPTYHRLDPLYITRKTIPVMKDFMVQLNLASNKPDETKWRATEYHNLIETL